MEPLVSIITVTYNHEKFIGQCIESVLAQSFNDWEMIIIDDGSTDKTSEIIAGYKDKRIKYIKQKNKGIWKLGESYNKALDISEGEFIAILEGDDFWPSNKLEKQLPSFDNQKVVLSWGKGGVLYNNQVTIVEPHFKNEGFDSDNSNKKAKLKELILSNFVAPAVTVMIRKKKLLEVGGFKQTPYTPYVDYPTWLELALVGEFLFVNEVLGFWRRHPGQATARMRSEQLLGSAQLKLDFYKKLPPEAKEIEKITEEMVLGKYYWYSGRAASIKNQLFTARECFIKALKIGPISIKLRAFIGLFATFINIDLEKLLKSIGKLKRPLKRLRLT